MKNIVILGATGTIGRHLAESLKNENLIVAGRTNPGLGTFLFVDLANFKSVIEFSRKMEGLKIDLFFINSGASLAKETMPDGIDKSFMVNCFSPYYIVKRVSERQRNCTFVLTSSISILKASSKPGDSRRKLYKTAKLDEHKLFHWLEAKDTANRYTYAHPGIVGSSLSYSLHGRFIGWFIQHFGNSASQGAQCLLEASKLSNCRQAWVCPAGWFHLRGKPKKYKIKRSLELNSSEIKEIERLEEKLEVSYGI